jgi:hypothetical protein
MKKSIIALAAVGLLAGSAVVGGYMGGGAVYSDAYADGVASVDAGPSADPAAADVSALPDPVADPAGSASAVLKLWRATKVPAIVLAAFLLAVFIHRKGYLKGRAAFYLGSIVSVFAIAAERAAAGDLPSVEMLASAGLTLVLAIMKFEFSDKASA